jgi:hypothetical protein
MSVVYMQGGSARRALAAKPPPYSKISLELVTNTALPTATHIHAGYVTAEGLANGQKKKKDWCHCCF